eukprot:251197_1
MGVLSPQALAKICCNEIIPEIGHKMLIENSDVIRSFFIVNDIDSEKLFSIKPTNIRDLLIEHSSNKIKGGPANKLFYSLKHAIRCGEVQQTIQSDDVDYVSIFFSNLNIKTSRAA